MRTRPTAASQQSRSAVSVGDRRVPDPSSQRILVRSAGSSPCRVARSMMTSTPIGARPPGDVRARDSAAISTRAAARRSDSVRGARSVPPGSGWMRASRAARRISPPSGSSSPPRDDAAVEGRREVDVGVLDRVERFGVGAGVVGVEPPGLGGLGEVVDVQRGRGVEQHVFVLWRRGLRGGGSCRPAPRGGDSTGRRRRGLWRCVRGVGPGGRSAPAGRPCPSRRGCGGRARWRGSRPRRRSSRAGRPTPRWRRPGRPGSRSTIRASPTTRSDRAGPPQSRRSSPARSPRSSRTWSTGSLPNMRSSLPTRTREINPNR